MSPRRIAKALAGMGAVALIVLLGVTVLVVRHRSDSSKSAQNAAGLVPGTLLHVHNFHWTQMKAGARQWVLTASDANYASDRTSLALTNAELTMVSDDGKAVMIDSPHAVIFLNGNHVTRADMSGGTVIHYGDFIFSTDAAKFLPDDDHVEADGEVTVEGEGLRVTGTGLSGNSKTRVFELHKQVSTHILPKHESENAKAG
jgi:LPS export ABC transporter protein LptC